MEKEQIPAAGIVNDKFHIVSDYNDVIDEIRSEECPQARNNEDKAFIKGQRFNLFKNPWNPKLGAKKSL